jgi:hypothetical protein
MQFPNLRERDAGQQDRIVISPPSVDIVVILSNLVSSFVLIVKVEIPSPVRGSRPLS